MNEYSFHCRSVSHHITPLAIREQLTLTTSQQSAWLTQHAADEAVIVSTCNRLELYAFTTARRMNSLWADLLRQRDLTPAAIDRYAVTLSGPDVARHLFRVSCGLESMALGEPQILGQVTTAYHHAHDHKAARTMLSMLFRSAIHAAKRARTETDIGFGSASVSALGITRAEQTAGPLTERNVLIIGAGEMAQIIVKALAQRGVQRITILSRTFDRAHDLAQQWGAAARPITDLKQVMTEADVLFTTSSAPFTVLTLGDVEPVMALRVQRPLCIIDIAMPRDVDPAVAGLPHVCLHDLDDLQNVIEASLDTRHANVPAVERIIQEELDEFWANFQARAVVPTIRMLREHAEQLRQSELNWIYNRLPPDSDRERSLIDQFSHRLMNKMLHDLTNNLKAKVNGDDGALVAAVARDLFGLEDAAQ